jgi:hypothetical protein
MKTEISFLELLSNFQPIYCDKLFYIYFQGGEYPVAQYSSEKKYRILNHCFAIQCTKPEKGKIEYRYLWYFISDSSKVPQYINESSTFDEPQTFFFQNELKNLQFTIAAGTKHYDFLVNSTLSVFDPADYNKTQRVTSLLSDNFHLQMTTIHEIEQYHEKDIHNSMIDENGSGNNYHAISSNLFLEASLLTKSLSYFDSIKNFVEMGNHDGAKIKEGEKVNSNVTSIFHDATEDPTKMPIIKKYGIIRSFIDICHDYTWVIVPIINYFIELIHRTHEDEFPGITEELIKIKTQIITIGGTGDNVNQISCRNVWNSCVKKYRIELGITNISSDDFGNIGSYSIWTDPNDREQGVTTDFETLIELLKDNGFTHFCVESQNCPAGKLFIERGLSIFSAKDWKRDAGSGYSNYKNDQNKTIIYDHRDLNILYNEEYTEFISKIEIANNIIEYGPNCLPSRFLGLIDMVSFSDDKRNEIYVTYKGGNIIKVSTPTKFSIIRKFPQNSQFSLNGLIQTANDLCGAGLSQPRGEGNARRIEDINLVETGNDIKLYSMVILFLKTYTDYIQAYCMEAVKGDIKCLTLTIDNLCARTFDGLFACPVALLLPNKITVSIPDLRYFNLSIEDRNSKFIVFRLLNRVRIKEIIYLCVQQQVLKFWSYLKNERNNTYNAAIYYACDSCLYGLLDRQIEDDAIITLEGIISIEKFNSYDQQDQEQYLRQFPNTLSEFVAKLCKFDKVSYMFDELHEKFMSIISLLFSINARMRPQMFVDNYYSIKQDIINVLKNNTENELINIHIACLCAFVIGSRSEHYKTSFILTLRNSMEKIDTTKKQDVNTYFLIVIMIEIVFKYKNEHDEDQENYLLPDLEKVNPNDNYEEDELRKKILKEMHEEAMADVDNFKIISVLKYEDIINCATTIVSELLKISDSFENLSKENIAEIIEFGNKLLNNELQEENNDEDHDDEDHDGEDHDDEDAHSDDSDDSDGFGARYNNGDDGNITGTIYSEQLRNAWEDDSLGGRKNTKSNKLTKTKKPKMTRKKKPKMTKTKKPKMTKTKKPKMTKTKKPKMTKTKKPKMIKTKKPKMTKTKKPKK